MSRNYGSRGVPQDVSPYLRNSPVKDARDCLIPMGMTSENVAERYGVGREAQDAFALESHRRAEHARESGHFEKEIVPVTVRVKNEETGEESESLVAKDDGIRSGLTLEKLKSLKPVFKDTGGSTAGNS
jgi:acetyl-CoA acyltransferase 1